MYETHTEVVNENMALLENYLKNSSTSFSGVKKAAEKCAEYHFTWEHNKQHKMWTGALSAQDAERLGVKPVKENENPQNGNTKRRLVDKESSKLHG